MTITNPTLAGGGTKTFASSSSAILTLYGVQRETISKDSSLINFPMPLNDSDAKIVFDLMGVSRTIKIEGTVTVDDVASLYNYAQDLAGLTNNSLIFGNQGNTATGYDGKAGYAYTPEILNRGNAGTTTIIVYVESVNIVSEKANPNSFTYDISLIEAKGSTSG